MTEISLEQLPYCRAAMARLLANAECIIQRDPNEIIGDRYLKRWHCFRSPLASQYVHLYLGSDPTPWLHDHPWPSASLCLRGVLRENRARPGDDPRTTIIRPGTLSLRSARLAHRLELVSGPALTIFLAGPRIRQWGWHLDHGWRHWRTASRVHPDGVTRVHLPPPARGDRP